MMEYNDPELTVHQRKNLAKLAAYLRTLPADYPDFEMDAFVTSGGVKEGSYDKAHKPQCGTAACAAGHGPIAGIRPRPYETWDTYSHRAFVDNGTAWQWCFSGDWSDCDNTVHGAAARIEMMLTKGVPDDFDDIDHEDFVDLYTAPADA